MEDGSFGMPLPFPQPVLGSLFLVIKLNPQIGEYEMFRKIFYLTLLLALLLTACGPARSATPTELPAVAPTALTEIKLTDGLGRHSRLE